MANVVELWVNRENFRDTKTVTLESAPLQDGQIRVAIDKFASSDGSSTNADCISGSESGSLFSCV